MDVPQTAVHREVRPDFPGISNIKLKTRVELAARRQTKFRLLSEEALSIAHDDSVHWVIEWIAGAAGDLVVGDPIAKDVGTEVLTSVIFDLLIALIGRLRRKDVWSGAESIRPASETRRTGADGQSNSGSRVKYAAASDSVPDAILEFCITEADLMSKAARIEICPNQMAGGVVLISKRLVRISDEPRVIDVVVICEAVIQPRSTVELIVEAAQPKSLVEGGVEGSRRSAERCGIHVRSVA